MAKLLLNEHVDLCCGRGCPERMRSTCYRYALHQFYDVIAVMPRQLPPWFIDPPVIVWAGGTKAQCNKHMNIIYQEEKEKK